MCSTFISKVGEVFTPARGLSVEWRVGKFFSLSDKADDNYVSPVFCYGGAKWYLILYPNGETMCPSEGNVSLYLIREDLGPPETVHYTLGIKGSDGIEKKKELVYKFLKKNVGWGYPSCWSRSELGNRKAILLPNDVMTITCDLRSGDAQNLAEENKKLQKEVESSNGQIKTLQKTVENYKTESESYKKQIHALKSKKSTISDQYNSLLDEKLTTVSGLEKENEKLQKEVESSNGQIKTLQKTVEDYKTESESYKKQISALESKKSSVTEQYNSLLDEKLTTVSELEKDKEELQKKVELSMDQIRILQKTVGDYELESLNLKEKIGEMSSMTEKYKSLLEEKLITISRLEKENEQFQKGVKSSMEQIKILQKAVENYEMESENLKKLISTAEREKSSVAEQYKSLSEQYQCLMDEKLTTVSGLEKENAQRQKEVESLMGQINYITSLHKADENYEMESEYLKRQISSSERENLPLEEKYNCLLKLYKCLVEEKTTTASRLEKVAIEHLKEEVESLKERNEVLNEKLDRHIRDKCKTSFGQRAVTYFVAFLVMVFAILLMP